MKRLALLLLMLTACTAPAITSTPSAVTLAPTDTSTATATVTYTLTPTETPSTTNTATASATNTMPPTATNTATPTRALVVGQLVVIATPLIHYWTQSDRMNELANQERFNTAPGMNPYTVAATLEAEGWTLVVEFSAPGYRVFHFRK